MMPGQIKVGAMIRRGAAIINAETMRVLVENESKVQEICAEIDARSAVFRSQEQATQAAAVKLETTERDLAVREAKLVDERAALEANATEAANQHRSDMEVLSRRTNEVVEREGKADARDAALNAREASLDQAKAKFRELTDGLKTLSLEQTED